MADLLVQATLERGAVDGRRMSYCAWRRLMPVDLNTCPRSVLIVDESDDSREVLRTALLKRGCEIFEAREARTGAALAQQHRPGVIVLDMEVDSANDPVVRAGYDSMPGEPARMVVLGGLKRSDDWLSSRQHVCKPYHYAPLIRKIEEMLNISADETVN